MTCEQISELGRQHLDADAGDTSDRAHDLYERAIVDRIREIATRHGLAVARSGGSMGSRYYDVHNDADSFSVRISNHRQAHAGPIWSFDSDDSAESIQRGFDEIARASRSLAGNDPN